MTTFTINEQNEIVGFESREAAAANSTTPFDTFSSEQELAELAAAWPSDRLIAIWNSLPGVTPIKKLTRPKTAISRIWTRIQGLGASSAPAGEQTAKVKAKGAATVAKGASRTTAASKKATSRKAAPKAKRAAKAKESAPPREGSKTAQVVAMLQRKSGATLVEVMEKMGWQRHTVRGFMAGAMKKAGYTVASFEPEGGERTYRIGK